MNEPRRLLVATVIGAGYGGMTSALNDLSSAYGVLGSSLAGTTAQFVLRIISAMTGAGWAWAALAVAVGWYLRTALGAAAGALTLTAATTTYYALDELLRGESILDSDIWIWSAAALLLGIPLGAVGAYARRPGSLGLLAALTVPVGAAVQMVLLPPVGDGAQVAAEAVWARGLVWLLSAATSLWIIAYYRGARPAHKAVDSAA